MSDEPGASARIAGLRGSPMTAGWSRCCSSGVDIPRLGSASRDGRPTELFFRQVVGRFIRTTPRPEADELSAPARRQPARKQLAFEIEKERRHAIELRTGAGRRRLEELDHELPERSEPGEAFQALQLKRRRARR